MSTPLSSATRIHPPIGRRLPLLAVLAASLLAGCASMSAKPPEEIVKKRSEERWQALVNGQFDKAYEYLAPSYRAVNSFERYRSNFGNAASWQNAQVLSVACETDKCDVRLRIQLKLAVRGVDTVATALNETWLLEDGKWWLFQKL